MELKNKYKTIYICFLLTIVISSNCIAQNKFSFKVCDVPKSEKLSDESRDYEEILEEVVVDQRNEKDLTNFIYSNETSQELRSIILGRITGWEKHLYDNNIPNRKLESFSNLDKKLISTGFHPFVGSIHLAYAQHYPLSISPDMIWLLIAQGFATHINENHEILRKHFVEFEGKKDLNIHREFPKGYQDTDWLDAFPEFSEKIAEETGRELLDLITGDFTTTGEIEKAAFQITLMDAMKNYFSYSVFTLCGIPEITLEGTVEDWKKIEKRVKKLSKYDLKPWVNELLPIIREFINASKGKPDNEFWQSIYKLKSRGSGGASISGWILKFFPYLKINSKLVKVNFKDNKNSKNNFSSVTSSQFPSGLSSVDFIWDWHGIFYKMEFVAGFIGCHQNTTDLTIRPEISWAVIDQQLKVSQKETEDYKNGGNEEYLESIKK